MPIVIDKATGEKKRVEVVMNPYSTINRRYNFAILKLYQNAGRGNLISKRK